MSHSFWRIAIDARTYAAEDLTGAGAKLSGGRWNDVGVAMIYAASSRALACLETIVHLNAAGLPFNRYLVEIEIADDLLAAAETADAASLSVGWDAEPAGHVSVRFGSDWANDRRSALLLVPSVVVPEEQNLLVNPAHPDAGRVRASKVRRWLYDPRLRR
ncbi:MAG: type II toxin-antitoxin system Prs ADP-ribosylating toxin ParT [Janthinobacterium lividum]